MSDDVKAAEARLRHELETHNEYVGDVALKEAHDAMILARWALSLLDETPATKDWCKSVGFETRALYQGNDWLPTVWGKGDYVRCETKPTRSKWKIEPPSVSWTA